MNSNPRIDTGNYVEVNILNCGHIVTCLDYELHTSTCPFCGLHIQHGTKIKFTPFRQQSENNLTADTTHIRQTNYIGNKNHQRHHKQRITHTNLEFNNHCKVSKIQVYIPKVLSVPLLLNFPFATVPILTIDVTDLNYLTN